MNLTEQEKLTLEIFTSDAGAFDIVEKIMKEQLEEKRLMFVRNFTARKGLSNAEIGANIRAFDEAVLMVESIFREIAAYRKQPEVLEHNPGR